MGKRLGWILILVTIVFVIFFVGVGIETVNIINTQNSISSVADKLKGIPLPVTKKMTFTETVERNGLTYIYGTITNINTTTGRVSVKLSLPDYVYSVASTKYSISQPKTPETLTAILTDDSLFYDPHQTNPIAFGSVDSGKDEIINRFTNSYVQITSLTNSDDDIIVKEIHIASVHMN